jgi:parvulin-like peptidyl-prolyl isomerase
LGSAPGPVSSQPADPTSAIAAYRKHHQLHTDEALEQWCFRHALHPADLLDEALNFQARQDLPLDGAPGSEESLFLRFKDRLDRVLYGLIRVDQQALARDLFFAIEAGELRFGDAARRHSSGPEARTEGIVGPVDLATPHPEISSRLKIASPGELIFPFKLDQWYIILRLDYRFEASLDQATRQFLRGLTLRSQARAAIESELIALASWLQAGPPGSTR